MNSFRVLSLLTVISVALLGVTLAVSVKQNRQISVLSVKMEKLKYQADTEQLQQDMADIIIPLKKQQLEQGKIKQPDLVIDQSKAKTENFNITGGTD